MTRASDPSPLADLAEQPADALLALIAMHRADLRPATIDLGVGVYRNARGETPVMRAVKTAERRLWQTQGTKAYIGAEGDPAFLARLAPMVFGDAIAAGGSLAGICTPGGTGALRLGAELYVRARPEARIWIGTPTWPNHAPIFTAAKLTVETHAFYNKAEHVLDFDAMMAALGGARAGDMLLLHGCCHNPTGVEFSTAQWHRLADFCVERGITPFIDLAYQGLGEGWDADANGLRALLDRVPTALIAYSCDKNFGLYRDRVGAFWLHDRSESVRRLALQNMLVLARCMWSMPPDHGAALVASILADPDLVADWRAELTEMRERLSGIRAALSQAHPALAFLNAQRGLFGLLPLSAQAVASLRRDHGIYMAESGRINLAGLGEDAIARFAAAVVPLFATA